MDKLCIMSVQSRAMLPMPLYLLFFKIYFEPFPIRYKREFVYFGTMDMADMMGLVLTMLMIMKLIIIGWGTGGWVDGWRARVKWDVAEILWIVMKARLCS